MRRRLAFWIFASLAVLVFVAVKMKIIYYVIAISATRLKQSIIRTWQPDFSLIPAYVRQSCPMKDRYERYFYLTWQITCAEEFLLKGDNSN